MVVSIGQMKVCVMKRCGHMQITTQFSRYGIWKVDLALEHIIDPSHAAIVSLFLAPEWCNTCMLILIPGCC